MDVLSMRDLRIFFRNEHDKLNCYEINVLYVPDRSNVPTSSNC